MGSAGDRRDVVVRIDAGREFLKVEAVARGFCLGAACGKRGRAEQGS